MNYGISAPYVYKAERTLLPIREFGQIRGSSSNLYLFLPCILLYQVIYGHIKISYIGCSLNIVFFLKLLWFFCQFCFSAGVWPAIVYTHWHRGETERGQSPEYIFKSSKKKTIFNERPVVEMVVHCHDSAPGRVKLVCVQCAFFLFSSNISTKKKKKKKKIGKILESVSKTSNLYFFISKLKWHQCTLFHIRLAFSSFYASSNLYRLLWRILQIT